MTADGHRLGAIAARFALELKGDPDHILRGAAPLASAGPDQLSFLANSRYRSQLADTRAGCVIMTPADADDYAGAALLSTNPYLAWARSLTLFDRRPAPVRGIHANASVDPTAIVPATASVGPGAVIGPHAALADGVVICAGAVIGDGVRIAEEAHIGARAVVEYGCQIGPRTLLHPGAIIGADGFGLAHDPEQGGWTKIPQLGAVRIGADCEIGANTTIDRGALEDTVLEDDVRLDNQIQIAHNVVVGAHTAMAGCSAVAGSTRIGKGCMIAGGVGILGHLEICDHVTITAMSLVTSSITKPGTYSSGAPLQENAQWRRNTVRIRQLDDIARRLRRLEK